MATLCKAPTKSAGTRQFFCSDSCNFIFNFDFDVKKEIEIV